MGKSKRDKRSWREVDVGDVDSFLEDQRLQERLGTDFSKKADHELFTLDTKPLSKEELDKKDVRIRHLTRQQRNERLLREGPRCFQSLVNTSKVSDPLKKRNHVKPVKLSEQTAKKNFKKVTKKVISVKENRARARAEKEERKKCRSEFTKDLWNTTEVNRKNPTSEWLSYESLYCNKLKVDAKRPPQKETKAMAVNTPHPGISYNPSFKEHQGLLEEVVKNELKVMKEEQHLNRVTSKMFRKITPEQLEKEKEADFKQHLQENIEDDDGEYVPINPPVRNKKKDLKTKRHIREHREMLGKAKEKAVEKKKLSDIYKLRFLQKSIVIKEGEESMKKLKRTIKKATEVKLPQISSRPFTEPEPQLYPVEDISGNLRNLKPQGGGLAEQFTSLQRRGLASVSKIRTMRKSAMKRYKLSSHRMPWDQVEKPAKGTKPSKKQKK